MTYPKSVSGDRLDALIDFASMNGCLCLSDYQRDRTRSGTCIGCWALRMRIERVEAVEARAASQGDGSPYLLERVREMRDELRSREAEVAQRRAEGERHG